MSNQELVSSVDPDKIKAIARSILGIVAILIPGSRWVSLLAALLDALAMEARAAEARGNFTITQGLSQIGHTPVASMAPEVREAYKS